MIFIYSVGLILLLFLIYIATQTLKFRLRLNLNEDNMDCTIFCLYPLLKIMINIEDTKAFLIIYLLKMKVLKTPLKIKNRDEKGINLLKTVNPNNVEMTTYYGFKDPFTTGMVCGAFSMVTNLINVNKLQQFPNFTASNDYIYVDATADINVGHSIISLAKNKKILGGKG